MNKNIPVIQHKADICVIGGGLAGLIAAVSAARHGAKVVLMQDRPGPRRGGQGKPRDRHSAGA